VGLAAATSKASHAEQSFNDWSVQFGPSLGVGNVLFTGAARAQVDGSLSLASGAKQTGAVWGRQAWLSNQAWRTQFQFTLPENSEGLALVLHPEAAGAAGRRNCIGACGIPQAIAAGIYPWARKAGLNTDATELTQTLWPQYLGTTEPLTGQATLSYNPSTQQLRFEAQVQRNGVIYNVEDTMPVNLAQRFGESFTIGILGGASLTPIPVRVSDWLR
jgi:hypothetical protein